MNRIKSVLAAQGRKQEFLSRMMNKSTNTISNWCTNRIQPSVEDLYTIAKILNCKVSDLLMEEEEILRVKELQH